MFPSLGKRQDLGALHRVDLAPAGADEHFQRMVGFGDGDRMPQAVIRRDVGNGRHLLIGVACAHENRASADDCGANRQRRAAAVFGDHGPDNLHRRLLATCVSPR